MSVEPLYQADAEAKPVTGSSSFLMGLIRVLWGLCLIALVLFSLGFLASLLALFGVEAVQAWFSDISPMTGALSSLTAIIGAVAFLVILKQLKHICHTLSLGDPFVPENAGRLRIIWIAVAIAEGLRLLSGVATSWLHNRAADDDTVMTLELRIYVWFLVLALVVLAEVFREGARLRQEQKLTI